MKRQFVTVSKPFLKFYSNVAVSLNWGDILKFFSINHNIKYYYEKSKRKYVGIINNWLINTELRDIPTACIYISDFNLHFRSLI